MGGGEEVVASQSLFNDHPVASGLNAIPERAVSARPAAARASLNSSGVTNRAQSWVPRGSQRKTYSAPTMASAKDLSVRLMVETIISPPGASSRAQVSTNARGSGTCSITSRQSTRSKLRPAATRSSVRFWR